MKLLTARMLVLLLPCSLLAKADEIKEFCSGAEQHDDLTLVIIQVR